jgi:hypothetical protein
MDLSGFDTQSMTYLATLQQHPNVAGSQDPFQEMLLPTEFGDHQSTYGGYAGYVRPCCTEMRLHMGSKYTD